MENANEKIDVQEASITGLTITSSFAFALGMIYFLAYLEMIYFTFLDRIPFIFVLFSLLIVFNLSFTWSVIDQLLD